MNDKLYLDCLILCSGHYLCSNYPDNWYKLDYDEQLEFIANNLWEVVENEPPELIKAAIESAATCTQQFIEELNEKEIKESNE